MQFLLNKIVEGNWNGWEDQELDKVKVWLAEVRGL